MVTADQLEEIGLSPTAATLYLTALRLGPSSVLALSGTTGLNRPLIYKTLASLIEQGVFQTTILHKRRLYAAAPPERLLKFMRMKEELLQNMLPDLENLAKLGRNKANVLYFEGREQVQELLKTQNQAEGKELYAFFPSRFMIQLFGKRELETVIRERIQKGIHAKILRPPAAEEEYEGWELREEALREVRFIDQDKLFGMGMVIFDDKVNLFSPIQENFGIQIESQAFSRLMRFFFETVWNVATPTTPEGTI